jgi:hypothetical protein
MDYKQFSYKLLQKEAKKLGIKTNQKREILIYEIENYKEPEDTYTRNILEQRYNSFKRNHMELKKIKDECGLDIRHENLSEDISENIAKFIIRNYEKDTSCKWAKAINKRGDLYSDLYTIPPEVKAFTSDGPTQFGPDKKFGCLYFLDMRKWMEDIIILWKVNLTHESPEFKKIPINKTQSHEEQCAEGRRPRINWERLYPHIHTHCVKIYDGNFDNIFNPPDSSISQQLTEPPE